MATVASDRALKLLRDADLFREACDINGRWVSPSGSSIPVKDPEKSSRMSGMPSPRAPRS